MSFFPTADFDKMHTASSSLMFTQSHPLVQTPPQSTQPDKFVENFADSVDAGQHLLLNIDSNPTTGGREICGLGLMPFSTQSTDMSYHVSAPLEGVSFSWSAAVYATSQPETTQYQPFRRDSCTWSDNCDPMSTILPNGAWHGMSHNQAVSNSCEAPPSLSPYSAHSSPSAVSTPYSRCEDYSNFRAAPSPMVKIEDSADTSTALDQIQNMYPLESSLLVRPRDVETTSLSDEEINDMFPEGDAPQVKMDDMEATVTESKSKLEHKVECSSTSPRERTVSPADIIKMESLAASARSKRTYTNEDNACCACDKCGKLFQREFNLRAHMETHDPGRRYPHVCQWEKCTKRFVRRTDLNRHLQSVHYKKRDQVCLYCNASFSRKDTLIRHVDDGCPQRTEYRMRLPRSRRMSKPTRRQSVTAPSPLRHTEQYY